MGGGWGGVRGGADPKCEGLLGAGKGAQSVGPVGPEARSSPGLLQGSGEGVGEGLEGVNLGG